VCHDHYSAHQGVEHDRMNVLTIGARIIGPTTAEELADAFIAAQPSSEERHARRFGKVQGIEARGE
jgi:ribose 5-phosphate isomerase B